MEAEANLDTASEANAGAAGAGVARAMAVEPVFEMNNLFVAYGQSEIVRDFSLSVASSDILAVLGLNGMGKTTLMKCLIGLLPVSRGSISLAGKEITALSPHERVRLGLAYVPQGRMVFPRLSVEENILAGLAGESLEPLEELYGYFPVLREMRRRRAGNLSGGQQQQLVIARALASNPQVLLLDEPTEGIQPSIIKELARRLVEIRDRRGLTIIVTEQVLSFALAVADRAVVMERGRLAYATSAGEELDADQLAKRLSL